MPKKVPSRPAHPRSKPNSASAASRRGEAHSPIFSAIDAKSLTLLKAAASFDGPLDAVDEDGCTPLLACTKKGWIAGARFVLPRSDTTSHDYGGRGFWGYCSSHDVPLAREFWLLGLADCARVDLDATWSRAFASAVASGHAWTLALTLEHIAPMRERLLAWTPPPHGWLGIHSPSYKLRQYLPYLHPGTAEQMDDHVQCMHVLLRFAAADLQLDAWGWKLALKEAIERKTWALCEPLFCAPLPQGFDEQREGLWTSLSEADQAGMPLVAAFMERLALEQEIHSTSVARSTATRLPSDAQDLCVKSARRI